MNRSLRVVFTIRPKAPNGSFFWLGKDGYLSVRALTSIASAAATQLNLSYSAGSRKELSSGRARVVSRGCTALEISRGSAAALSGSLCFRAALAGCGGLPAPRLLAAPG